MAAKPVCVERVDTLAEVGPIALPVAPVQVEVATALRRAWRDQVPAVIILRRARPS